MCSQRHAVNIIENYQTQVPKLARPFPCKSLRETGESGAEKTLAGSELWKTRREAPAMARVSAAREMLDRAVGTVPQGLPDGE